MLTPTPAGWVAVEQDPTGLWWITIDDTTTGPYLDEVQATRTAHTRPGVVVHTTTTTRSLQCTPQTPGGPPITDDTKEG